MRPTGERAFTAEGGFRPQWKRHVATYALAAPLLPPGRVLDLGCGVGHSYDRLAPRETVGVDVEPAALEGQERETHAADMRSLPFADGDFASVLSLHSVEHVPDPERVLAEVVRVLEPGGVAIFATPNRLTFGRPDEIVDPYHHVEFDPEQLRALCAPWFDDVEVLGLFASPRYMELFHEERARLDRLLRTDPLRLRRAVPRRVRQILYDRLLARARRRVDPRAEAIEEDDFFLRTEDLDSALDLLAVCRGPVGAKTRAGGAAKAGLAPARQRAAGAASGTGDRPATS
jgi:SAM-dependent methyltransferase